MDEKAAVFIYCDKDPSESSLDSFSTFIERIRSRATDYQVEGGICGAPVLGVEEGLGRLVGLGTKTIVCVPATLFGAAHDIDKCPSEITKFASDNPQVKIHYARDLVVDARLLIAARDQITRCLPKGAENIALDNTLLMVVGSDASNPVANSNVAKAARMIWEGMGLGWTEVSYCGNTKPSVSMGMAHALRLGFKRIIVFPGFLFSNEAVRNVYKTVDSISSANPDVEILYAAQITDHPMLLESFMDRIHEALNGSNTMNCLLCSYREQIVGPDHDQQEANHAHSHSHSHDEDHNHAKLD